MFCGSFSSKSKATNIFPKKHFRKLKARDQSKQARKKLFCHVIINNYLCNIFCKFLIKVGSTWRRKIKGQTPLLTLLYCGRTVAWKSSVTSEIYIDVSNFYCFICLKVQGLDCMTVSGIRVWVTCLVLRKPKTNTFDECIKFLHWLFLVVLDGFRLF